jgi:cupin 2 domain-containing protein
LYSKEDNLYKYITPTNGEIFKTLLEHKNIKIIRIVSSDNVDNTLYIQKEDEWVIVIDGQATLDIDGIDIILYRGDSLLIPSKTPHRVVETTSETIWLVIHIY